MKPVGPFTVQAGRGIVDANGNLVLTGVAWCKAEPRAEDRSETAVQPEEADAFARNVCGLLNSVTDIASARVYIDEMLGENDIETDAGLRDLAIELLDAVIERINA